jgi:cytidylate kinase
MADEKKTECVKVWLSEPLELELRRMADRDSRKLSEYICLLQEGMGAQTTGYFNRDVIRYRARNWYGVGMRDDRFAFLSTSTTAPVVA